MVNESYMKLLPLWQIVNDCYEGVEAIKSPTRSFIYLPPQPAERKELESGTDIASSRYMFRKNVATYVNLFRPTINDIVGLMQKNKPKMRFGVKDDNESPQAILDMRFKGTRYGDGLTGLKTRLNHAQALFGRYGMLLDVVTDQDGLNPEFCITEYPAFSILDGDYFESNYDNRKQLRWILLDESTRKFMSNTKMWVDCPKRRVLGVNADGVYYNAVWEGTDVESVWASFDFDNPQPSDQYQLIFPTYQDKYLDFIPFTVCNVDRLGVDSWQPPQYLDVAQIAIGNYIVDSWYKMGLYQFATPTLVISNAKSSEKNVRLGGVIWLNSSSNSSQSASATILETSGSALSELRNAKQELRENLRYSSISDLIDGAGANSSGEALKLRTASGTAAIATMDKTGARAIEEQIRFAAIWAGATKDEAVNRITFEADTTYIGKDFEISNVVSFLQANTSSKLLSKQNAYAILERTFPDIISNYEDNQMQIISDEEDSLLQGQQNAPVNAPVNAPELPQGQANINYQRNSLNDKDDDQNGSKRKNDDDSYEK